MLGSPEQQWYGHSEKGQQKAVNILEVLEYLSYEEKQRELGPLSLEKRRLRGVLPMYTHTDGGRRADGARLFSVVLGDGTRGTDHSLKHGKCHLKLRKILLL